MESAIVSILVPAILSTLLLLVIIKKHAGLKKTRNNSTNNLPPGPWKLPIIGNIHQLIGEHPHRRLGRLASSYGPLLHLKLGEINLIVITSVDMVREIFKTQDIKFSSRPKLMASKLIFYDNAGFGFAPYGKHWSQLRKICTVELLSLKRVKSFSYIREEEGNNFVGKIRMAGGSPVNLSQILLSASNTLVARAAFGKSCAHQQSFLLAMKKTLNYLSGFKIADLFPSSSFIGEISGMKAGMERVHKNMDAIFQEIIDEHQAKNLKEDDKDEDLIDVLLRIMKNEESDLSLTITNIKAVILDLFFAGTESTPVTLSWAMTELIRHPEIMQKAQLEVRKALNGKTKIEDGDVDKLLYLNQVIKETLRLHPVSPLLPPRTCLEMVEIAGYTIPSNSRVLINAWAIMRDSKYWKDPEIFRPERFEENALEFVQANFEYIPFGGGRRICPGISFSMSSMGFWLAQLLFYFNWELPGGKSSHELDMEETFGLTLARKNDLYLVATYHE